MLQPAALNQYNQTQEELTAVSNMLPDRLRLLRQEKHLTQMAMAQEILVPRVTYTHYELGKRTPDLDTIMHLARFHQVSVDFLIGNTKLRPMLEQWLRENNVSNMAGTDVYSDYALDPERHIGLVADNRSEADPL
jgi:transcriptional regulator with XRE-family HTH domain